MEAENQNSWRKFQSELDQLSEVPGEAAFNTNAAWNKLSARLEAKSIHRKPAFYCAAAAILLLLLSAGWLLLRKPNEINLVLSPAKTEPSTNLLPPDTSFLKSSDFKPKENLVIYYPVNSRKKPSISVNVQKKKRTNIKSQSLVVINNHPEAKIKIAADSLTSMIPQAMALVQSPPLKKLKVIHNNQLNSVIYKPDLSISNTSSLYPPSSGSIRFSRNASDNIFQIKISSTN